MKKTGVLIATLFAATSELLTVLLAVNMISITGGIIGMVPGVSASKPVTLYLAWPTLVSESPIILSFAVCAITGVLFCYYPAQEASGLDPVEALRYE